MLNNMRIIIAQALLRLALWVHGESIAKLCQEVGAVMQSNPRKENNATD